MAKLRKGEWVRIEWHDAAASCTGWTDADDAVKNGVEPILTVGYVLKASRKEVILAQSFAQGQALNTQAVPRAWITKVEVIG